MKNFFKTFEARSSSPCDIIDELKELLANNKVVKMSLGHHVADLRDFYNELSEGIGITHSIAENYKLGGKKTGKKWMEVRYDENIPDMDAYRHSKNAQPYHTDESYISNPCDIMIFYCVNKAPQGGNTIFVDGLNLVNRMKIVAPDLLERLSTSKVKYAKGEDSRLKKIIDLDIENQPKFNFNYYCISESESDFNKKLNQQFFDFLETHVKGSFLEKQIELKPGESVFWWDEEVLHGRNPFEAHKTNDRFIWKTGVSWNG